MAHDPHDDHHEGLAFDVATLLGRRQALRLLVGAGIGAGLIGLAACGSDDSPAASATTSGSTASGATSTASGAGSTTTTAAGAATTATAAASGESIPEETAGPYPGDGSNGPNVLTESGIVRSDITSSIGSSSGTA